MSFGKKLLELIRKNDSTEHKSNGGHKESHVLSHQLEDLTFQISFDEVDRLSLVIRKILIEQQAFLDPSVLRKQADFLKSTVTYLLESIENVEIDEHQNKVQLRSVTPYKNESSISYYEIIVEKGRRISLERVVVNKNEKRRKSVSFVLTNEVFERTINDLANTLKIGQ